MTTYAQHHPHELPLHEGKIGEITKLFCGVVYQNVNPMVKTSEAEFPQIPKRCFEVSLLIGLQALPS